MDTKEQAVYDASLAAARRLGQEGFDGELIITVVDSPEVQAVLPKWGVGNLPPSFVADVQAAYQQARS